MKKKRRGIKLEIEPQLINSAVEEGVDAILEHHPRFKEHQKYIERHIDRKKLREKIEEIYENIRGRRLSDEKKREYLFKELSDYIATGAAFDEEGKETILKSGLEERAKKGFFKGLHARRTLEGEKYLDEVIEAFGDLYHLFERKDYSERMPELKEAVATIYDMGFLDPAVDILKYHNLIDKRKYNYLKKIIKERVKEESGKVLGGIEKYITSQKIAASILLISGIGLILLSSVKITGMIIGNLSDVSGGLIGVFLILISLILFFRSFQK